MKVFDSISFAHVRAILAWSISAWVTLVSFAGCTETDIRLVGEGGMPIDMEGGVSIRRDSGVAGDSGRSSIDAGTSEPCGMSGALERVPCGMCGTVERFCSAAGVWVYGECGGETGECVPGATDTFACGTCGAQSVQCSASCTWETTSECMEEGMCTPGSSTRSGMGCPSGQTREVRCTDACVYEPLSECSVDDCPMPGVLETVPCGMCGTVDRFCNASRVWEYGTCENEGVCAPGTVGAQACGMCGEQRALCTNTCTWVASGECTHEGMCRPGAVTRVSTGCPSGQTRLMRCGDACTYSMVEPCTEMRQVDVTFLIDSTGSNEASLREDLPIMEARCIAPLLALAGVQVGVSYAGEFPVRPYGVAGDRPFEGGIEPVASASAISAEIMSRPRFSGGDMPDSMVEALSTLSGGAVHPGSLALTCSSGRVAGGCWRSGAERVIVVHTDSPIHNGPNPNSTGLLAPYTGFIPAPAQWPAVQSLMMSNRTALIWFDSGTELPSQFLEMLSDLGQPSSDHHITRTTTEVGSACDALVARVRGMMGS